MAFGARARVVNPRLGTYFSIFAALFTVLFLLVLIFEQLSFSEAMLKLGFFVVPILIYAGIGLSVGSNDTLNYFAAGRRVPAAYTGLLLAASALGSTLLVAGTGAFFFSGFDALVLMMGTLSGFVVMAITLARFIESLAHSRCRATSGAGLRAARCGSRRRSWSPYRCFSFLPQSSTWVPALRGVLSGAARISSSACLP
jgi:hypothetical protein